MPRERRLGRLVRVHERETVVTPGDIHVISWPYHNGLREVGMGAGAAKLAADEALRAGIEAAGWRGSSVDIEPTDESEAEIARVIELVRGWRVTSAGPWTAAPSRWCSPATATAASEPSRGSVGTSSAPSGSTRTPTSTIPRTTRAPRTRSRRGGSQRAGPASQNCDLAASEAEFYAGSGRVQSRDVALRGKRPGGIRLEGLRQSGSRSLPRSRGRMRPRTGPRRWAHLAH
jgi:hypothetical protein